MRTNSNGAWNSPCMIAQRVADNETTKMIVSIAK